MKPFHGILIYEILENGNLLNGIYTNNGLINKTGDDYCIDTEIARKISDNKGLEGHYDCKYVETNVDTKQVSVITCVLDISNHNGVYKFIWRNDEKQIWTGLGLMAGTTHIAVSYDDK